MAHNQSVRIQFTREESKLSHRACDLLYCCCLLFASDMELTGTSYSVPEKHIYSSWGAIVPIARLLATPHLTPSCDPASYLLSNEHLLVLECGSSWQPQPRTRWSRRLRKLDTPRSPTRRRTRSGCDMPLAYNLDEVHWLRRLLFHWRSINLYSFKQWQFYDQKTHSKLWHMR